ncbi:hypothetical protein [Pararobbsia silviterrae]|uniref:Uncharacterized protein n=1 Tax=Pararobbsia silviterrae TaxID=1792498 RepID=A0A494XDQ2_9BURK|nr:hypothetical protein [Pararobbsia silviterrae]RKP48638.1 hypothetical protein D7S86_21795 [Pararobbsia silviterrae]
MRTLREIQVPIADTGRPSFEKAGAARSPCASARQRAAAQPARRYDQSKYYGVNIAGRKGHFSTLSTHGAKRPDLAPGAA